MAESLGGLMMTKLDPASAGGSRGAPWCERSARKQDEGSKHYSKLPKRCIQGAVLATRTEKDIQKVVMSWYGGLHCLEQIRFDTRKTSRWLRALLLLPLWHLQFRRSQYNDGPVRSFRVLLRPAILAATSALALASDLELSRPLTLTQT
jgi:hypothetical protein